MWCRVSERAPRTTVNRRTLCLISGSFLLSLNMRNGKDPPSQIVGKSLPPLAAPVSGSRRVTGASVTYGIYIFFPQPPINV